VIELIKFMIILSMTSVNTDSNFYIRL